MYFRVFCNIPGLYPPDSGRIALVLTTPNYLQTIPNIPWGPSHPWLRITVLEYFILSLQGQGISSHLSVIPMGGHASVTLALWPTVDFISLPLLTCGWGTTAGHAWTNQ